MPNHPSQTTETLETEVLSVHCDGEHKFSKITVESIELVPGFGVMDDAHFGTTVQHRSRVKADPTQPNLRQVHLISADLFTHLADLGFSLQAGQLGENITLAAAQGLGWRELIELPRGTRLVLIDEAGAVCGDLELTGLRNPCIQIDDFQKGLLAAMLDRNESGKLVRKTGVMSIVHQGGTVTAGTTVRVVLPPAPHISMERI